MINFQTLQEICVYHGDAYGVDGHVSFCYFAGKDIALRGECNELDCPYWSMGEKGEEDDDSM